MIDLKLWWVILKNKVYVKLLGKCPVHNDSRCYCDDRWK